MDAQQVLTNLQFGRVDAETDYRIGNCFIGTEMLRQVLQPQHSLLIGSKGSGKSAIFRLLSDDLQKIKPLLPKGYEEIFTIPVYGLQSEEYLGSGELKELNPTSVDDFRYFWLLYLGLKAASNLSQNEKLRTIVERMNSEKVNRAYATMMRVVQELGLMQESDGPSNLKQKLGSWMKLNQPNDPAPAVEISQLLTVNFQQKVGISIMGLLDAIDVLLRETNCLAWMMLDKLDLLFVADIDRLKTAITALIQLLVEYSNRFKNIHFKVFLRTDIYHHLRIVNKSHLVSYTSEMKWRGSLLMRLLISRAAADPMVKAYCEELLGESIDVTNVIIGSEDYVLKIFYAIFEPSISSTKDIDRPPNIHEWILKRLVDGTGCMFPREMIHLGNLAAEKQREINRMEGQHSSSRLISARALKQAFEAVSQYRCDTYLYSEFPHLAKHFDVFRGSDSGTFHREELYMLFEPLTPKGDEAIRAVYYAGLLTPMGRNVDSSDRFKVPLLYKSGLGILDRRPKTKPHHDQENSFHATESETAQVHAVNW